MKWNGMVKEIIAESGIRQIQLAKLLGFKGQSGIAELISRKDIRLSILTKMLDILGYEIVVQKKKPGRRPDGQFLITTEEEQK